MGAFDGGGGGFLAEERPGGKGSDKKVKVKIRSCLLNL